MKNVLGLDLGTNSIGWSIVKSNDEFNKFSEILAAGSRIIPMDAATLGDFDKGNSISQTAERTRLRGVRRLIERSLLRRERLHRILRLMKFLPRHYEECLDRYGKFLNDEEPKLAWVKGDDNKYHFIFETSFKEMLSDFMSTNKLVGQKIPYDWTIYYLRKKALTEKITKEELAWVLLNFNQKRGYYQLREEEEQEDSGKVKEFYELKVVKVEATDDKKGKDTWYNVHLENGWIYRRSSREFLDWEGKYKQFIVTTDVNLDGTLKLDKEGNVKRNFSLPKEDDWTLIKKKTEKDINQSGKTIGEYIYDMLLNDPTKKIKGGLIRTIERHYYKEELIKIIAKQKEFHPELNDKQLYDRCIKELYDSNDTYRQSIQARDFSYLLINDILFYQRPLKTKKHLIADCQYEFRYDKKGNKYGVKCVAKSHPLYAEFRLWQFLDNLRIYCNSMGVGGSLKNDVDVTSLYLQNENDYVSLFKFLYSQKTINQKQLLSRYIGKKDLANYRWNYVDKDYPCNETRYEMLKALKDCGVEIDLCPAYNGKASNTDVKEEELWHILYSIDDKSELQRALKRYGKRHGLPIKFAEIFAKIKPYKKEYGSYSLKAIKKLLPLMRRGDLWNWEQIDNNTKSRIDHLITGEFDDKISNRVREKSIKLASENDFKGLPLWLSGYIVYNRHSESLDSGKWYSPNDVRSFVNGFQQHSLRNPIVEQVVLETLRTVADIWEKYGSIDEIHLELGREMKNPADKRAKLTATIQENENTNLRIRKMLQDFMNSEFEVENVRPDSPSQQEMLKIYEEYVLANYENDMTDDIVGIRAKYNQSEPSKQPTKAEALRYKLWLEQGYRSPYTGEIIPLGKLFTPSYEIEHIIPQSRYFDDSLSNKVICESEVNKLKDNQLGYEFVKNHHGQRVQIGSHFVEILDINSYEELIKKTYGKSQKTKLKMKKLLMDDIPDGFIERQMNDSRYISKYIKGLLSRIVKEENETEAVSKQLITCSGGTTDRLKKDWGINDKWNELMLSRFLRLNDMTKTTNYTYRNKEGKIVPSMPLSQMKGFNKKRIDHRHHAMDAIVIACTTRDHVNLLNNESALSINKANRYALQRKLRRFESQCIVRNINGVQKKQKIDVAREFLLPWDSFPQDVYNVLNDIVVSFKSNTRVINKASNKYEHIVDGKKKMIAQEKGDMFVVRKPMHKDTVFGLVNLKRIKTVKLKDAVAVPEMIIDKEIKSIVTQLKDKGYDRKSILKYLNDKKEEFPFLNLDKIEVYYFTNNSNSPIVAVRKDLVSQFAGTKDAKKAIDIIDSITDTGIQLILKNHLLNEDNNVELAFSADGLDRMNENIISLNGGKYHQPIKKARFAEVLGNKYQIGESGAKATKYVEAAKGTNLFYGVYVDEEGKRCYETIPFNIAIALQEQGLHPVPEKNEKGNKLLFYLSPNDLVYVPTVDEIESGNISQPLDKSRIYKAVSFTGNQSFFINDRIAFPILNKFEFSSLNKMERAITGEMIKESCIPITVDRLGNMINEVKFL